MCFFSMRASPDEVGPNKMTPLHFAARYRYTVRTLGTRQYCRVNETMFSGHKVVLYCNIQYVKCGYFILTPRPNIFRFFSGPWGSMKLSRSNKIVACPALNLTDDAIAYLFLTKFSTISLYFTKLYVPQSIAIAASITYNEIRQNFYNSVSAPVSTTEFFANRCLVNP